MTTPTKPIFSQTAPPQLDDLPYRDYDPEIAGQLLDFIRPYSPQNLDLSDLHGDQLALPRSPYPTW